MEIFGLEEFSNSENKPLEQLFISTDGCKVAALDKRWAPRDTFANYICLVMPNEGKIKTGVELEEWRYEAESFREDMKFLLSCKHHEFWSYMVYQKQALSSVITFLQRATPFYLDVWSTLPTELNWVKQLYEEIIDLVLRVICRLTTNKESKEAWITKDYLRILVYTNYLISVPMLLDLLVAVGDTDVQNLMILKKIFKSILQLESKYQEDLLSALNFFHAAFRTIQTQAENEGFEGAGGGIADDIGETPYDDVALYTLDCGYTLALLLEVSKEMCVACAKIKMGQSIANFYDTTIPFLYKNIFLIKEEARSLNCLNQARVQFLKAFRCIANHFLEIVLSKPEESIQPAESFIGLLTECLSEQMFVIDYGRAYPVDFDMDILKQACKDLDGFKATFVIEGYTQSEMKGTIGNISRINEDIEIQEQSKQAQKRQPIQLLTLPKDNIKKKASPIARDMDVEVAQVLDVFPTFGTGFVRRVLSRYENSEETITAILEENLPPDLAKADRLEPYIPDDPKEKLYKDTGIKHFNVHDGDAFDVLTQDTPNCIIKQGKGFPNAPKNAAQMLDDKTAMNEVRQRYQEYTLVSEGGMSDNDEYNDEYDDSYEALLESEARAKRSKELKAGLANVKDVSDDDDETESNDEDSEQTTRTAGGDKKMNFCENPEDIRARYEAQRQAKWGRRHVNTNNAKTFSDVQGAPKGQGQEKETLRNRNKKEVNKSSRANHNRKSGAAFKRSKGMIP